MLNNIIRGQWIIVLIYIILIAISIIIRFEDVGVLIFTTSTISELLIREIKILFATYALNRQYIQAIECPESFTQNEIRQIKKACFDLINKRTSPKEQNINYFKTILTRKD